VTDGVQGMPAVVHWNPDSTWHIGEHLSPSAALLSSHDSPPVILPSPQGDTLAADFENVLEAGSGDESRPRAFAFQQRVGGDRGTVDHVDFPTPDGSFFETCEDHLGGRAGVRTELEGLQAPGVVEHHEIGERAPGIHAYSHSSGLLRINSRL